jgi:SAM-dependent methyltransferase
MSATDPAIAEWREIARGDDVLYDVLSWPEKRGSWTEAEFYATGASDFADFKRHWEHYQPELGGACVEIGCGVGRITAQLAQTFSSVTALDVSADMIARARKVAPAHVRFEQVDAPRIPVADGEIDAVFSVHVMQHLESIAALRSYVAESRRVLRSGGTAMIHIPLQGGPPTGRLGGQVAALRGELELRRSRRALRRGDRHTTMRTRAYWLNDVWRIFTSAGFRDVELRLIPVRSNGYGHQFWLGRA